MVYANFSSNLPTGLQNFEFVDLTIFEKYIARLRSNDCKCALFVTQCILYSR